MEATSVIYKKLFGLQVVHDFYKDNISRDDLSISPTSDTLNAIRRNGMLYKTLDSAPSVFYRAADTGGTPFVSFANVSMVFGITVQNAAGFMNFTDLSGYTGQNIFYFTNKGTETNSTLTKSFIDFLRPASFSYNFPQAAVSTSDVGHIKITDAGGNDVTPAIPDPNNILTGPSLQLSYPVDFTTMPKGLYTFETWTTLAPTHIMRTVYIDTELARQNVFGIVEIVAKTYSLFPANRTYNVGFSRRQTQWKYFVVLKSGNTVIGDTITIPAAGAQTPYPALTFVRQSDTVINGINTAVFASSQTNIPFFEEARLGLDIVRGTVTVVQDIAGPSLGVTSGTATVTEIFVFI